MKTTKIIYWVSTILFAGFIIFSALPDALLTDDAKKFIMALGYPVYIIRFLGIAKLLGSIAILQPWYKGVKEWAYSGIFFDLIGAVYSVTMSTGIDAFGTAFFAVLFGLGITSYFYFRKVYSSAVTEEIPVLTGSGA